MAESNQDGFKQSYVSGYKVTFSETNTDENTDIPERAMFYGEIGEKEKKGNNPEYTQNALEEIGDRVPADFVGTHTDHSDGMTELMAKRRISGVDRIGQKED